MEIFRGVSAVIIMVIQTNNNTVIKSAQMINNALIKLVQLPPPSVVYSIHGLNSQGDNKHSNSYPINPAMVSHTNPLAVVISYS